ncbi:MAG: hypothetical protein Q4A78_03185 [Peptostreptococcaceae bacterium]|nr:hypothetical protein [Peptostreptococcaceae bacterium]
MALFNFKALIARFGKHPPRMLVEEDGHYDYEHGGLYIPGPVTEEEFEGAVVPLSAEELKYEENGKYGREDRKLYCYEAFEVGDRIRHKGLIYTVDKKKDYSDFDEALQIYFLVRGDTLGTDEI